MSLVINHNMMAMNTARNLNNTYGRLSSSVEKLSSGLRINSAADDAAGLAIRELMRADISTMKQGIRNAADAISMIQTADGGMAVIDEKLTRMKELAEQAATGTYTTLQREIINSEYQAMAAEIDRIATATNFNGVKLLDGSITNLHGGQGMKIHFGVGNSADEDYYFINTGDVRATSSTGLRIGGDAKNDIWGQGAAGAKGLAGPGCCTAGYASLDGIAGFTSGQTFAYGYNWDWMEDDDPDLLSGKYLAGRYTVTSSNSLQDLIDKVNRGTQSRVGIQIKASAMTAAIQSGGTMAICVGEEAYVFGSATIAGGAYIIPSQPAIAATSGTSATGAYNISAYSNYASYSLTSAQIQELSAAGIDIVNILKLNRVGYLTGTGFSSADTAAKASAAAASAVVADINAKIAALKIAANLSAIAVSASGTNDALSAGITTEFVLSQAGTGLDANGHLKVGASQTIHTGIFVDDKGNWTTDAAVATTLGFNEISYVLTNTNNDSGWEATTTGYTNTSIWTGNNGLMLTESQRLALSATGLDLTSLNLANPFIGTGTATTGPGTSSADAKTLLSAQTNAAWEMLLNTFVSAITVEAGSSHTTLLDRSVVTQSLTPQAVTDVSSAAGASATITTGIYYDSINGNWTTSASIATIWGLAEIKFDLKYDNIAETYAVTPDPSSLLPSGIFNGGTWNPGIIPAKIDDLLDAVKTTIDDYLFALQTAVFITGKTAGFIDKVVPPTPDPLTYSMLQGTSVSENAIGSNPHKVELFIGTTLQTSITIPGITIPGAAWTGGAAAILSTSTEWAEAIRTDLKYIIDTLQTAAAALPDAYTAGEIVKKQATKIPPAEWAILSDKTINTNGFGGGIEASGEQTIQKVGVVDRTKFVTIVASAGTADTQIDSAGVTHSNFSTWALASAINHNARSQFWAMTEAKTINQGTSSETVIDMIYIFCKDGGDYNNLLACEVADGDLASRASLEAVNFENLESGRFSQSGTSFSLGGQEWGKLKPIQTKAGHGNEVWNLTLHGRDVGYQRDLWIAALSDGVNELTTPGLKAGIINGLDRYSFVEMQNAADGPWVGAEVRTQSAAQEALIALNTAMERKDKVRADIGALQNRLENTITNLEIQVESLQASESRISDVDVATEMTEFVRNQVLAQAAVSMLSQANSLPQMALSLLNG